MMAIANGAPSTDDFTLAAVQVLSKSSDVALRARSNNVKSLCMFLVLLVGTERDLNSDEFGEDPTDPTLLWSVIARLDRDPVEVVNAAKIAAFASPLPSVAKPEVVAQPKTLAEQKPAKAHGGLRKLFRRARPSTREIDLGPEPSVGPATGDSTNVRGTNEQGDGLANTINRARELKVELGDDFVAPYHLIIALSEDPCVQDLLSSHAISKETFVSEVKGAVDDTQFTYLARFTKKMTARDPSPIVGRDDLIRRVIQILGRKTKNSAVLLGEPGVGKTAVVEALVHRIATKQVPSHLKGTVYSLDLGTLFAGAGKGEYEERVKGVIDDVTRSQQCPSPAIVFIDELHLIAVAKLPGGPGSGVDAANLLKPALARGQFRCIGATTIAEYRQHIEKDGALERRFAKVMVNEPTVEEATIMLRGVREIYERHHHVWITDQAIVAAVNLACQYLTARRLPDSAVDLLDEACAAARISQVMKPEALDTVEHELSQVQERIKILQRDDFADDRLAIERAQNAEAKLDHAKKDLEEQQEDIIVWWQDLYAIRQSIKEKVAKSEVKSDGGAPVNTSIEVELNAARKRLANHENSDPRKVPSQTDRCGRYRDVTPVLSPDIVTPESIAAVVERATKIPVQRLLDSDKTRLRDLEAALSQQVVGQPDAVEAVARAIQLSRTGLRNTDRPIASFMFTGPSGTGKTLLAKVLAHELFGKMSTMIRIDGSEYSHSDSVTKLIGTPPGYKRYEQGGQLTEFVRQSPYCIVLLDEIEKTCAEFHALFLQVLDEGRLTDGQGRLVDFRNTVIIMTSNIGADVLSKRAISDDVREKVVDRFKERFRTEFLNRIDDIIVFNHMSQEMMSLILNKHLRDLLQREGLRKLDLRLNDDVKEWLIEASMSQNYGARPLVRVVQRELLSPLSGQLLRKTISEGDTVVVLVKADRTGLDIQANHERLQA